MKENSIKFTLKRNEKEIEITGEIEEDNTISRMGKPVCCNCKTIEEAIPLVFDGSRVYCPNCGEESISIYTFQDYENEEMENIHLKYFATDYLTMQKLYKVSYTLPYESWKLVESLFMKLSPDLVDLGDFEPNFVGWVTSNPEAVEDILGVKEELKVANQIEETFTENKPVTDNKKAEEEKNKKTLEEILAEFSIMETPESPEGMFELEGVIIDNPFNPPNDYGGGEYFVINQEYIWFVRMNSRDTDNWDFNNIHVKGTYGAIGKRIPYSKDLEEKVRSLK